jgi:hypothetical protein
MIDKTLVEDLLKSRIKYLEDMYTEFITTPDKMLVKESPMDFKNYVIWDCQKALKKIQTQ